MEEKAIFTKIIDIMADIGPIGKDKQNKQQGFKYRGIDDVMNHLQPLFIKHRVVPVVTVTDRKREAIPTKSGGSLTYTVLTMNVTLYAENGSNVVVTVDGEAMDPGDKSTNKAISVGYKYAMFTLFCIPTDEMIDPDGDTPPVGNGKQPAKKTTVTSKNVTPNTQTPPNKTTNTDSTRRATKAEIDRYITDSKGYQLYPADDQYATAMVESGALYQDLVNQMNKIMKQPLQPDNDQEA